jgi:hypothetical protein
MKRQSELGNPFARGTRLFAILILIGGFFQLYHEGYLVAIICFVLSLYVLLLRKGIAFDTDKEQYSQYVSLLGYTSGEWKSYAAYPDLVILRKRIKRTTLSRGNATISETDFQYEIYLMDAKHRKRLLIAKRKKEEEARKESQEWSAFLKRKYAIYSPVLSAQSKRNRRAL